MTWQHLSICVRVILILLPTYLLRTQLFGIPTTALELMLAGALLMSGIIFFQEKTRKFPHKECLRDPWVGLMALLMLTATISVFVSPNVRAGLGVYRAYIIEPILFSLLLFVLLKRKVLSANQIYVSLGICALFLSIFAIIQWFFPYTIPIPWDAERRVTSVFDYPNALGLFLAPIVTIALVHLAKIRPLNQNATLFWITTAITGFLAIILAQSEAALVALLATGLLYGISQKNIRWITVMMSSIVIVLIALSPWRVFVFEKLTLQDYSGQIRLSQWSETWNLLKDHPLFGAGLSGYPTQMIPYHTATHIEIFQYPHNIFLNIWTELGLLGLLVLVLLCIQIYRSRETSVTAWLIPFFALVTLFIHGLVDVPFFKNDLAILTLVLITLMVYATKPHSPKT